jgi:predicted transposase/invertase (TIGR01784 family)
MSKLKYSFKSDILFKLTFVKYKHLLKVLVALVLKISVSDIYDFAILNSEIIPEAIGKKLCRLDIHLKVNREYVDIEMQVNDERNFAERLLVYWSKVFAGALPSSENYVNVPRTILISFVNFKMFSCKEYCSQFVAMEKSRHEILTNKMSILVFELDKLPEEIDRTNILELFLRLFRADTEEEMENLEKLGVDEMTQMLNAYRDIVSSPDYIDLERKREMNRLDEGQALYHAKMVGKEEAAAEWQGIVADKDAAHAKIVADKDAALAKIVADRDAEIERLRAQLSKNN